MAQQLLESIMLMEDPVISKKGDTFTVSGTFAKCEVRNENGRKYKTSTYQRILADPKMQQRIKERRMVGELGHPDIVETTETKISHIVTALELRPDGSVWGSAEILNTPSGQILRTLYEARVKMGISSRGYLPEGSNLYPDADGAMIVPDDFELVTYDFVIDPSTPGANPTVDESQRKVLSNIVSEGRDKINSDVVKFVESLSPKKSMKLLSEAKDLSPKQDKNSMKEDKKVVTKDNSYNEKLLGIISDLKERYMTAESIIDDLMQERVASNEVLQDLTNRYKMSESIIKELRDYANSLEESMVDVTKLNKVSEGVISDLKERYLTAEKIIEELRDRYLMAESVIANLREVCNEAKQAQEDLRKQCSESEKSVSEIKDKYNAMKENLTKSQKGSTSTKSGGHTLSNESQSSKEQEASLAIINELKEKVKSLEAKTQKKPVPEGYFEGISEKYHISVSEAKSLFKSLGNKQKAFEFHLEERKKLVANKYNEFPYMIDTPPVGQIYESKSAEDAEKERIARIVSKGF